MFGYDFIILGIIVIAAGLMLMLFPQQDDFHITNVPCFISGLIVIIIGLGIICYGGFRPIYKEVEAAEYRIQKIEKSIEETKLTGKAKEAFLIEKNKKIVKYNKWIDNWMNEDNKNVSNE